MYEKRITRGLDEIQSRDCWVVELSRVAQKANANVVVWDMEEIFPTRKEAREWIEDYRMFKATYAVDIRPCRISKFVREA